MNTVSVNRDLTFCPRNKNSSAKFPKHKIEWNFEWNLLYIQKHQCLSETLLRRSLHSAQRCTLWNFYLNRPHSNGMVWSDFLTKEWLRWTSMPFSAPPSLTFIYTTHPHLVAGQRGTLIYGWWLPWGNSRLSAVLKGTSNNGWWGRREFTYYILAVNVRVSILQPSNNYNSVRALK